MYKRYSNLDLRGGARRGRSYSAVRFYISKVLLLVIFISTGKRSFWQNIFLTHVIIVKCHLLNEMYKLDLVT